MVGATTKECDGCANHHQRGAIWMGGPAPLPLSQAKDRRLSPCALRAVTEGPARSGRPAQVTELSRLVCAPGGVHALVRRAGAFAFAGLLRRRHASRNRRRPMANAEKVAAVAELKERFETSSGAVLANYR